MEIVTATLIGKILFEKVIGPLYSSLTGYLSISEYLKIMKHKMIGQLKSFQSEELFWRDLIGPYFYYPSERRLNEGNAVELKDFLITEWFPRCPGLIWTEEGLKNRMIAQQYKLKKEENKPFSAFRDGIYLPMGKSRMILGGYGTIRLGTIHDEENSYKILCATSSSICDQGIPIVVTEDTYNKIREPLQENGIVQAHIKGFLSEIPFDWRKTLLQVSGTIKLKNRMKEFLSTTFYVPRYCLYTGSQLAISDIHKVDVDASATAWTLFKSEKDYFIPHFDHGYSFTYANFNPREESSIKRAAKFLERYAFSHGGTHLITEFDSKIARLKAELPLNDVVEEKNIHHKLQEEILTWGETFSKNVSKSRFMSHRISRWIQEEEDWFKKIKESCESTERYSSP